MKNIKNYLLLGFIAFVIFFPVVPMLCFMVRHIQGLANLVLVYFITGFIVGFIPNISVWVKMLFITLPYSILISTITTIELLYPESDWSSWGLQEYIPISSISCYLGIKSQESYAKGIYKKIAINAGLASVFIVVGFFVISDYYYYVWYLENVSNKKLPQNIVLKDTKGNVFENKDLAGKVLVLDFWSTSCSSCIVLMKDLKTIEDKFAGNKNIQFVSINAAYPDTYEAFLKSKHVKMFDDKLTMLYDANQVLSKYMQVELFPKVYLVDKKGNFRRLLAGYWGEEVNYIRNTTLEIEKLLKE
jgi:thiol-disulfide isomerase/thioredoxin